MQFASSLQLKRVITFSLQTSCQSDEKGDDAPTRYDAGKVSGIFSKLSEEKHSLNVADVPHARDKTENIFLKTKFKVKINYLAL